VEATATRCYKYRSGEAGNLRSCRAKSATGLASPWGWTMSKAKIDDHGRLVGEAGRRDSSMVRWMRKNRIPVTRENYLKFNFFDGLPDQWTDEHEARCRPCCSGRNNRGAREPNPPRQADRNQLVRFLQHSIFFEHCSL